MSLKILPKRITDSTGWTIHIDDGFVSYELKPKLKNCSIQDVANAIHKAKSQDAWEAAIEAIVEDLK